MTLICQPFGAAILALAAALPAQTATLHNSSGYDFRGWYRVEVATAPPAGSGWHPTGWHYVAHEQEPGHHVVDIWAEVPAYGSLAVDLAVCRPSVRPLPYLDGLGAYGQLLVAGVPITWQPPAIVGAGVLLRGYAIPEPRVLVTVEAMWWPASRGTIAVQTSASVVGPGRDQQQLAAPIVLSWGAGDIWVGRSVGTLYPAGLLIGRTPAAQYATATWPAMWGPSDLTSARALHSRLVAASAP